jgi:hypothetical protein
MSGTDGEPILETIEEGKITDRVKALKVTRWDYAIIKGTIVKGFNSL